MKLYHCPNTRSFRPLWLLEELGATYDLETLDLFGGAGRTEEYLAVNPNGTVPTLEDDGTIIYEAGAICLYLTDKHPNSCLAPALNTPQRAHYYQWMFYVPGTMEIPLVNIFLHTKLLPEAKRRPAVVEDSKERFKNIAKILDDNLADKPYMLGDNFSTADIMVGSSLQWFPELMEGFDNLQNYSELILARPTYQKAHDL